MKFVHTNIISTNWEKLAKFYVETFNCKIIPPIRKQSGEWLGRGTGLEGAKLEGAHLLLPGHGENGPTLEIYQYEKVERQDIIAPNKRGFGHIAFEVECVEIALKTLEKNGGKAFGEITKKEVQGIGAITFVYTRDPEGNLIELQNWSKAN